MINRTESSLERTGSRWAPRGGGRLHAFGALATGGAIRVLALAFVLLLVAGGLAMARLLMSHDASEPASSAARRSSTAAEVQLAEQRVAERPQDPDALARLGSLYLARARETGDPSFYSLAERAVERARTQRPGHAQALIVAGVLALARHDFAGGLALGEQARALYPDLNAPLGIILDAQTELGRYEEALDTAQQMLDRRPDIASLTRASYQRELRGDLPGAIELLDQSAETAGTPFDEAWTRRLSGDLRLQEGDLDGAERAYAQAATARPGDPAVDVSRARLALARGDAASAEALLRGALEQMPLPDYAIMLGELLLTEGRPQEAQQQFAVARAAFALFAANGGDAALETAAFEADYGDAASAFVGAEAAYRRRPSVIAADVVAWAAYRAGRLDVARRYSAEALRLGTREPALAYHAGVIALASGDAEAATRYLGDAQVMRYALSPGYREALRGLVGATE